MNNTLGNKNLYKIFIIIAKYIPYLMAIIQILEIIFNYLKISCMWLSFFGGCSIGVVILLFLISFVFRFCVIHRLPLYYTSSVYLLRLIDITIGIPLTNIMFLRLHFIIMGIALLIYGILLYKYRNNPKVDHIKTLCDNYCNL